MILKKCPKCKEYNLTDICRNCSDVDEQSESCKRTKTEPAHYKFLKLKDEEDIHPKNFTH